jgi:CRISPR-associated protein Cas1
MTAIYITDSEAVLQVRHGTLQVFQQHTLCISVPLERVSQILILGRCHLKQEIVSLVAFRRIPILFLLDSGREIIRSTPPFQRRTKYQNQQLRRAREPEFSQMMAESIVRAYLHNCCMVLQRLPREGCVTSIEAAERALSLLIDDLPMAGSVEDLWDYQAMAARF